MGVDFQLDHAVKGEWAFLVGKMSRDGWPHYFLIACLIKTPIALQALLLAALVLSRRAITTPAQAAGSRPSRFYAALCLGAPPLLLFTYMSLFSRIQIGIRYVLPVLPFVHILLSRLVTLRYAQQARAVRVLLLALAVYVAETASAFPHYLAYFNSWIGGPRNGYRYLIDSNLDWGQNAGAAQRYVTDHHPNVTLRPGNRFVHGRIVVNANALQGLSPEEREVYAWLRPFKPVGHIGYSYLIFDVPLDAVPQNEFGARGHAYLGGLLYRNHLLDRAAEEFRRAIRCAPDRCMGYVGLAACHGMAGNRALALETLARSPADPEVERVRRFIEALP